MHVLSTEVGSAARLIALVRESSKRTLEVMGGMGRGAIGVEILYGNQFPTVPSHLQYLSSQLIVGRIGSNLR